MQKHKSSKGPHTTNSVLVCPFPIAFDTYWGCSHKCSYCFANNRKGLVKKRSDVQCEVERFGTVKQLHDWCRGDRGKVENWCDWDIPIKFGVNSDPFQPCEVREGVSLKCLKVFAETGYPVIIITKGTGVLTRPEYLAVLKDCNCLVNVSMCCSMHDRIEQGAPKYEERLKHLEILSGVAKRTVARWQPFFYEFMEPALKEVPRVRDAGAYGVLVEGAYLDVPTKYHTDYWGGKYRYPYGIIHRYLNEIKKSCHAAGIRFLCSELRWMSDELTCCGTEGMARFRPCTCNATYKFLKPSEYRATARMCQNGTSYALWQQLRGSYSFSDYKRISFRDVVEDYCKQSGVKQEIERR